LLLARPVQRRLSVPIALVLGFVGIAGIQAIHGVPRRLCPFGYRGRTVRVLRGFGVAVIAVRILADPGARKRLLVGLIVVGLALGLWGLAQWVLNLPLTASGDADVRTGVRFTTAGRGQLQGGMFAFPVAIVIALGALLSADVRSRSTRALLMAVLAVNSISLLLTFERTFWLATSSGSPSWWPAHRGPPACGRSSSRRPR
jgi:hypothetical protein